MARILIIKTILINLCLLISSASNSQSDSLVSFILDRLSVHCDGNGLLRSYVNDIERNRVDKYDHTIFYNLLCARLLSENIKDLNLSDSIIADNFIKKTITAGKRFRNASGRMSWNFWYTDTFPAFPYSWWIPIVRKKITLPDDMDDTVLMLTLLQQRDSAIMAHAIMQEYVNKGHLNTTKKRYENIAAYSSWFGKRFPVVFDFSVLCNILGFVNHYGLEWTSADNAALKLITTTLQAEDHIKRPAFVSPYYPKTSLILYHLARLMETKEIVELEDRKHALISLASELYTRSTLELEKIILGTTLMRWGVPLHDSGMNINRELILQIEKDDYSFFVGSIPSYFANPFKTVANGLGLLRYYHYSPGWNDMLVLEYLLLRRKSPLNGNKALKKPLSF